MSATQDTRVAELTTPLGKDRLGLTRFAATGAVAGLTASYAYYPHATWLPIAGMRMSWKRASSKQRAAARCVATSLSSENAW